MRGRPPESDDALNLRGTLRVRGTLCSDNSELPVIGDPPDQLTDEQKEIWRQVVQAVGNRLTAAERMSLMRYCVAFTRWQEAEDEIVRSGCTKETRRGKADQVEIVESAHSRIAAKLSSELMQLEDRLGLNPYARAKVKVKPAIQNKDPREQLFA